MGCRGKLISTQCAIHRQVPGREQGSWNLFLDPPTKRASGSDADWKKLQFFLKLFKVFTYLLVFGVVLASSVAANLAYLYMAGNTNGDTKVQVCSKYRKSRSAEKGGSGQ